MIAIDKSLQAEHLAAVSLGHDSLEIVMSVAFSWLNKG